MDFDAVGYAVTVGVFVERVGACGELVGIGESVAVGVGVEGVGTVQEDFVMVGEAVAVGVEMLRHLGFHPVLDAVAVGVGAVDGVELEGVDGEGHEVVRSDQLGGEAVGSGG